ncbi:MAG TPA: hypothetical protein VFF65_11565 [Phycisphaerales bacterium]|nr:hypothetical protein [Phycisphaerales bacterium]
MPQRSSGLVRGLQITTIAFWLADLTLCLTNPDLYRRFILKDGLNKPGATSVLDYGAETLTVLVLIPGILCAIAAIIFYRRRVPSTPALLWLLAWTAASIYFAGEECSWGQWYFKWGTPEAIKQINDQGETNLHNTTSWLDQKPRALVELFIVCGGLIVPLLARSSAGVRALAARPLIAWALAPSLCWPAAAALLILRSLSFIKTPFFHQFANSEVCELATAWFLSLYLLSYLLRLKGAEQPGDALRV